MHTHALKCMLTRSSGSAAFSRNAPLGDSCLEGGHIAEYWCSSRAIHSCAANTAPCDYRPGEARGVTRRTHAAGLEFKESTAAPRSAADSRRTRTLGHTAGLPAPIHLRSTSDAPSMYLSWTRPPPRDAAARLDHDSPSGLHRPVPSMKSTMAHTHLPGAAACQAPRDHSPISWRGG